MRLPLGLSWLLLSSAAACGNGRGGGTGSTSATTTTTTDGGTEGTATDTATGTATDTGTGTEGGTTDTGPIFDIPDGETDGEGFPNDCDDASVGETTVGCVFYAVDLDQAGIFENDQFAAVVSNVQSGQVASVIVENKQGGNWMPVAGPVMVDPLDLHVFALPNFTQTGSGLKAGGAYRITSDVPIIAYQFNPLQAGVWSSDASLLYPATAWDTLAHVVQWGAGADGDRAYVVVVAATDGTLVKVRPTAATTGGTGVPAGTPGQEFNMLLNEGDIAHIATSQQNASLTGTRIEADKPIGVFAGHACAFIPAEKYACDHLEEQLSGVRLWGERFAAARMPIRTPNAPETTLWQLYASEDGTMVELTGPGGVTGLPGSPVALNSGDVVEFYAGGTPNAPGDFFVDSNKPVALVSYMTGWENLVGLETGDPAMLQHAPVEQFLDRYVVLVPSKWDNDYLVVTRSQGAEVTIDAAAVPDDSFIPIAEGYEVARVFTTDGVHELHGTAPFGVAVVGYDYADSYAYLGGTGTGKINPDPQG